MLHCAPRDLVILTILALIFGAFCVCFGFVWGIDTERGRKR
jgi:hypothetical protein